MTDAPVSEATNKSNTTASEQPAVERAEALVGKRWTELGSAAISKDKPAGTNVRLEDQFEAIENEIAKLDSLTDNTPVEWELICQWCEAILKQESKDILVACYLARSLCEQGLLHGLVQGLLLNIAIHKHHWGDCFPPKKRARGRAAAYNWWIERTSPLLEKHSFNIGNLETIGIVLSLIESLDSALEKDLGEHSPSFNELMQPLRRALNQLEAEKRAQQRKVEQANKPKAQPAHTAPTPSQPGSSVPAPAVTAGSIHNDRDLQNSYRAIQDSLRSVAEYLRQQGIADPEAFRINRFLTWLGVSQLPPDTNGVTQLRPPPKEKLQHYMSMQSSGNYQDLIPEVEVSISKSPYWLDGHRWVHEGLTQLGYADSAAAVAAGVREFLQRFPNAPSLKFSDQSGFADDETRQWINFEVMADSGSSVASAGLPVEQGQDNEWETAYQEAIDLYRDKQATAAFAVFKSGCQRAYSQRGLAFWRYYQARFCFEIQHLSLAIALLEALVNELYEKGYEQWEPDISAKIIELLIRAYEKQPKEEIPRKRVAALHEKLCQFDLATAYELSIN